MIKINNKNNYLEIINEFDIHDIQSAFYSKKHSTFDIFYLDEPTPGELIEVLPQPIGEVIGGGIGVSIGEGIGEPIGGGIGEPIEIAPQPIRIGNIQIKRFGGSIVIDQNSFKNNLVFIDGKFTDFESCVDFLSINTAT